MLESDISKLLLAPQSWKLITGILPDESPTLSVNNIPKISDKIINRHLQREILIPLQGKYPYALNGKYYDCSPGTIFIIDHEMLHEEFYTSQANGLSHIWLLINKDKILGNMLRINKGELEHVNRIMLLDIDLSTNLNIVWDELKDCDIESSPLKRQKLFFIIGWLFIKILEQGNMHPENLDEYQLEVVEASKKYIRKNFRQGLEVAGLARMAGYSKYHFLRLFKKYTKCTVYEYINACRRNEVEALSQKKYSQKEIAAELGFSCQSAFSNWCRKNIQKPENL